MAGCVPRVLSTHSGPSLSSRVAPAGVTAQHGCVPPWGLGSLSQGGFGMGRPGPLPLAPSRVATGGAARAQGAAGSPQHGGCHTVLGLAGWALSSLAWHRIRPLSGNALGSVPVTPSVLARGPGIVPGDAAEQRVLALPGGAGELEGERQRRDRSTWGKGCWAGAQGGGDGPCTLFPAGGSPGSWLCGGFGAGRALGGP